MRLIIETPGDCFEERSYILNLVIGNFLGLDWDWRPMQRSDVRIIVLAQPNVELILPDCLLQVPRERWFAPETLPVQPLALWDTRNFPCHANLVSSSIPVIYGDGEPAAKVGQECLRLPLDVFGSAFFMLTRYEEIVRADRDVHDRFLSAASLAHQEGFLGRPIVDEYVELLWSAMKWLWPDLVRKERRHRKLISCDIDSPYLCYTKTSVSTLKVMVGDVLKRKSFGKAQETFKQYIAARKGRYDQDPHMKAIDWIMEVNEEAGNKVAFYFIPEQLDAIYDGCYSMSEPVIRDLLKRIHARGHEIGLHASYTTYKNERQTCREANILREAMEGEGIYQADIGGRQHYLRWEASITTRNWEAAGMTYDSTLSFADHPGFRCGTCHEYPMYDLIGRQQINLRQRPLILMECSAIDPEYMGLGYTEEAFELMESLKRVCERFKGDFTLLWHNTHFRCPEDREFYKELIK